MITPLSLSASLPKMVLRKGSVAKIPTSIRCMIIPMMLWLVLLLVSIYLMRLQNDIRHSVAHSPSLLVQDPSGTSRRSALRLSTSTTNNNRTMLSPWQQPHDKNSIQLDRDTDIMEEEIAESMESLRQRLPPSVWTMAGRNHDPTVAKMVSQQLLNRTEQQHALALCGKFLYSTMERAVQVGDMGEQTFVATGDIDSMWTRDSAVQMGLYLGRMAGIPSATEPAGQPFLRPIVEGAIRRQAFNMIQDPYANAYSRQWKDPALLELKQRVIGRGGWVDTRNYEVDSGAYFLTQLYDYYVAHHLYRPEVLLAEPMIFDAVLLLVQTYTVEQHHDTQSPYRYFELPEGGKGPKTGYTGMTWSGFRPSDDPCQYGYLVPSNMHAAAGLERVLVLNKRIWNSNDLETMTTKLLRDMEQGIRQHGVVQVPAKSGVGTELIYAYEVDGLGKTLADFDDANVPSLLSIPLLGWSGYDHQIYQNTRARLLDPQFNKHYFKGKLLQGMGSPHTPEGYVWPLALSMEALTETGTPEHRAEVMAFQVRQSLLSACRGAMHEGVDSNIGCPSFSRPWFEWANAMFVVLIETALGQRCDAQGQAASQRAAADHAIHQQEKHPTGASPFYQNQFNNDHTMERYYQGIESKVKYVR